jgi:hypothetical protein
MRERPLRNIDTSSLQCAPVPRMTTPERAESSGGAPLRLRTVNKAFQRVARVTTL